MLEGRAMFPITPRGSMLIGVSVVTITLVILVVILRIIRNIKFKKYGWDEGLIIVATTVQLAVTGVNIASIPHGNGRHIYQIQDIRNSLKAIILPWVGQPLAAAALLLSKTSLAVTLLNLGLGKSFNRIVMAAVLLMAIADIWAIIQILAGCNPITNPRAGPCQRSRVSEIGAFFQCSVNIFVDVIFFTAPEYFLRKTKLNSRDRLVIRCLLAFVFAATIMSVLKLIYIRILLVSGDVTWASPPVSAASQSESGLSIIAACMPAVRQLVGQRFPKHWMFWKTQANTSRNSGSGVYPKVHRNVSTKATDLERGKVQSNVRIINDMDFSEEDGDAIELISHRPKPVGSATLNPPRTRNFDTNNDQHDRSKSSTVASPSPQFPPTAQLDNYADGLAGRLSSRYRALDPPDSISGHPESPNTATFETIRQAHPPSDGDDTTTYPSSNLGLSPSLSSRSSSPSHLQPRLVTPNNNSTISMEQMIRSGIIEYPITYPADEKIAIRDDCGTDSIDTMTALPTPAPPYYYENNKVRRSARPSLEQTHRLSSYSKDYTRTSTLDSNSVHPSETAGSSWLKGSRPSSP